MPIKFQRINDFPIVYNDEIITQNNKESKDITEKEYDKLLLKAINSLPDVPEKEVYIENLKSEKDRVKSSLYKRESKKTNKPTI